MKLKCDKKVCLGDGCSSMGLAYLYFRFPAVLALEENARASGKPTDEYNGPNDCLLLGHAGPLTRILISRQASRAILSKRNSARRSQDDIARLRERNLQLEDALVIAYSHISKDVHPLLAESPQRVRPQDDPEVDKVTEVLGTLTVGEAGELKYFGPSAIAEHLYQSESAEDKLISAFVSPQQDPGSIVENFSTQIPLGPPLSMESFVSIILRDLPKKTRAWALCKSFYERYAINSMPIQQKELAQSYLTPMYKYLEDSSYDSNLPILSTPFRPHRCAVAFFTFALGAWLDLNQEHYWVEADRYYQIGLSCLSMQSLFYSPEVASVEALFLLSYYHELRGAASTSTTSPSWIILSLASKISQGLGLHRDPAKWNLDKTTVQHRRWLYWELTTLELFLSLGTGRPTSNKASYVDTELPDDMGPTDTHGELLEGFYQWKHGAVRDCYLDVAETLLAATPVKYEVVLDLDRKVRAKEIPPHLNRIIVNAEDGPNLTPLDFMHTCTLGVARSMGLSNHILLSRIIIIIYGSVLLAIHRGHLTEALNDPSGNPLKSRYAPSFLSSYRAASWVVRSYYAAQQRFSALLARLYHPWTTVLTAAMVLGSIAINTPSSLVGNGPLEELRVASSMLKEAAAQAVSHRTKSGAKIVQNILAKAEAAQALPSVADDNVAQSCITIPPTNYGDDELAMFGGQARLSAMDSGFGSLRGSSDNFGSPAFLSGSLEGVHPSLIDFLNSAPKTQVASSTTFQEIQATIFEPPFVSPFHDLVFTPSQLDSWESSQLPASQGQYNFPNAGGLALSGSQTPDTFENYLTPPEPVKLAPEPSAVTPWQDFMVQHSLF
ncbi:hypothetical protein DL96DRAFT_1806337 [Flagelloscypha sp. PMI_526]|nr:hypothetical protein DL96DRAFT_1806337 [Flagelloscypha sp. PMI_526]